MYPSLSIAYIIRKRCANCYYTGLNIDNNELDGPRSGSVSFILSFAAEWKSLQSLGSQILFACDVPFELLNNGNAKESVVGQGCYTTS